MPEENERAAADGRRQFLQQLDELNANVTGLREQIDGLLELGHTLVLAMHDAARAQAGNPVGDLLGTLGKVASAWQDTVGMLKGKKSR